MPRNSRLPLAILLLILATPSARAQDADSVRSVVAGAGYGAGGLHRLFLGKEYRDLWTTPIQVPVLNLDTFAGGLTPLELGGGQQTTSLSFRGADGREYKFRSVDKDPSTILPPDLRGTIADDIIQDQISAANPAGALMAGPIMDAAGVLNARPELYVMPDSPKLGHYREAFAGMLGTIEEWPNEKPGWKGAAKVIGSDELFDKMEESPDDRVDARAFLRARLVDIYLGDWDRHRDQWRWARFGDGKPHRWLPIPRDRDQAFVKYNGLLLDIARSSVPQLVDFKSSYPGIFGLVWNGRELDRRILMELDRTAWDSVAAAVGWQLTDQVIDSAIARLPTHYRNIIGIPFRNVLRRRRDGLREAADRFYRLLADEVDIHATDADETLEVERGADGTEVRIWSGTGEDRAATPYYQRRFLNRETSELRIFLHGGRDVATVSGEGAGIGLRILGGDGRDVLVDSSRTGGIRYYGSIRDSVTGPVHVDTRDWHAPPKKTETELPPRDWGSRWQPSAWFAGGPGIGLFLGGGVQRTRYGFHTLPFSDRMRIRAGYATQPSTFRADFLGEFHRENSRVYTTVEALASGIEVLYFYGFGNETPGGVDNEFFRVSEGQYSLSASLVMPMGDRSRVSVGPMVRYTTTNLDQPRFISLLQPYGTGDFAEAGLHAGFQYDSRDVPANARKGFLLDAGASLVPGLLDVRDLFGEVHGAASTYLGLGALPLRPVLALRAGGRKLWGDVPYQDAAFIGDDETARLAQRNRYAGEASLYGNAELRFELSRLFVILPGTFGVYGLADAGRVFVRGESSDLWHTAWGGGLWFAFLNPANTMRVGLATSEGRMAVYGGAGFAF